MVRRAEGAAGGRAEIGPEKGQQAESNRREVAETLGEVPVVGVNARGPAEHVEGPPGAGLPVQLAEGVEEVVFTREIANPRAVTEG